MIGKNRHFISLTDFDKKDLEQILKEANSFKKNSLEFSSELLIKKRIALIFFKASTRTKVSFDSAIQALGGQSIYLDASSSQIGRGESLSDTVRVLERYVHGIVIRNDSQNDLEEVSRFSKVPIINGLSDLAHPCQAVADIMTILEKKPLVALETLKVVYLGDGNNVALSLAKICKIMGVQLTVVTPIGYECPVEEVRTIDGLNNLGKVEFKTASDVAEVKNIVDGSDVIYTDTWASMGQDSEKEKRKAIFEPFQVNEELVSVAKKDYIFLHCLPAYRGNEVSAEVIDGANSVVFEQAENRMYAQAAILKLLVT